MSTSWKGGQIQIRCWGAVNYYTGLCYLHQLAKSRPLLAFWGSQEVGFFISWQPQLKRSSKIIPLSPPKFWCVFWWQNNPRQFGLLFQHYMQPRILKIAQKFGLFFLPPYWWLHAHGRKNKRPAVLMAACTRQVMSKSFFAVETFE